jgi:predicted Zn finger-like uncharacterized protein
MIISCEKCSTKFWLNTDEVEKIKKSGRILKCGNCYHMWVAAPNLPLSSNHANQEELTERLTHSKEPSLTLNVVARSRIVDETTHHDIPLPLKLFFYAALFTFVVIVSLVSRKQITTYFPSAKSYYKVLGIYETDGLEIEQVRIVKSAFTKNNPFIMRGVIINNAQAPRLMPDMRLSFYNEKSYKIKAYSFSLPKKLINSGEQIQINNKLPQLPEGTDYIVVDIGNYLEFLLR